MEIPVLIRSLKLSICSLTSFQKDQTSEGWGVVLKGNQSSNPIWLLRETGNLALEADTQKYLPPS